MAEEDKALADFFGEIARHPEFQRVIGTFLCAAGTGEWYYPQLLHQDDGAYGDFSEPFRREYETFLRQKYGTVDELRRVWRRPDATFERPRIPPLDERTHVAGAEDQMRADACNWEDRDIDRLGFSTDLKDPKVTRLGVFLNVTRPQNVADFYDAWHESTARTVIHFARVLKRLRPNRYGLKPSSPSLSTFSQCCFSEQPPM